MGTLKKWKNLSKLGSQPPLKSAYPGSCRPKKLFLGRFFLENHFFDPFRPNEDPQVLYMAGKLWISSLWWYKEKNIFLHPVERMIFYDGPHRYFPLYWEAVICKFWWMGEELIFRDVCETEMDESVTPLPCSAAGSGQDRTGCERG